MNAAAKVAPSGATLSPEQAIDALTGQMADICKRLVIRIAFVERENGKLHGQLDDALDRVKELETELARVRSATRVT